MIEKLELLDIHLLDDKEKLDEIDYWLRVLNWTNGWHYDLDIVWILKHLHKFNIPSGSTIIDAGAGLGVMQFILAARGYNVISLDYSIRQIPKYSKGIFNIQNIDCDLGDYHHEYMEFMTYGQRSIKNINNTQTSKIYTYLRQPSQIVYRTKKYISKYYNYSYLKELRRGHNNYGDIIFLRGTFNDIPIADNKADALISISAIEHNNYEDIEGSIREFNRVIKPGALMMVTTSAAIEKDWYHEASKGWNFTNQTISKWFEITESIEYDYDLVMKRIKNSEKMEGRISEYYKYAKESGLPYGDLKKATYVPVGIIKKKSSKYVSNI